MAAVCGLRAYGVVVFLVAQVLSLVPLQGFLPSFETLGVFLLRHHRFFPEMPPQSHAEFP